MCYDCYGYTNGVRKDFRQDHGGGPEVIPTKSIKKKKDCKGGKPHEWENRPTPMRWSDSEKKMVRYETWRAGTFCKRCNKRQSFRDRQQALKTMQGRGCPKNDNNPHVYVWVKHVVDRGQYDEYVFYRQVCAGCDKPSGKSNYGTPPENIYETRTGW